MSRYYVCKHIFEDGTRGHCLRQAIPDAAKPNDASKDDKNGKVIVVGTLDGFWAQLKALGFVWMQPGAFGRKYWVKQKV